MKTLSSVVLVALCASTLSAQQVGLPALAKTASKVLEARVVLSKDAVGMRPNWDSADLAAIQDLDALSTYMIAHRLGLVRVLSQAGGDAGPSWTLEVLEQSRLARSLAAFVPAEELGQPGGPACEVVSTVLPLDDLDAAMVSNAVARILHGSSFETCSPVQEVPALVLTGYRSSLIKVHALVQQLRGAGRAARPVTSTLECEHADAELLESVLKRLIERRSARARAAGAPPPADATKVVAYPGRPLLVVRGSQHEVAWVSDLVKRLDVPSPDVGAGTRIVLQVVYLQHARARDLARRLPAVISNPSTGRVARIEADERTNSLLFSCPARDLPKILEMIEKLDVLAEKAPEGQAEKKRKQR